MRKGYIVHNDETGQEQYSVNLYVKPDYWLDSFSTLEEAEKYCFDRDIEYDRTNDLIEEVKT